MFAFVESWLFILYTYFNLPYHCFRISRKYIKEKIVCLCQKKTPYLMYRYKVISNVSSTEDGIQKVFESFVNIQNLYLIFLCSEDPMLFFLKQIWMFRRLSIGYVPEQHHCLQIETVCNKSLQNKKINKLN